MLSVLICCVAAWRLETLRVIRRECEYQDRDHLSILSVRSLTALLDAWGCCMQEGTEI